MSEETRLSRKPSTAEVGMFIGVEKAVRDGDELVRLSVAIHTIEQMQNLTRLTSAKFAEAMKDKDTCSRLRRAMFTIAYHARSAKIVAIEKEQK